MIVIFDIDGTLSDCSHRRHFVEGEVKDWEKFYEEAGDDETIPAIVATYDALSVMGHTILFVTGRDEGQCGGVTLSWLKLHCLEAQKIYFRAAGDFRPDDVVKEEILGRIRTEFGNPMLVFEDRKRVVDMYRRNGIICCQVAEGDF
jgi:hypothetical protein